MYEVALSVGSFLIDQGPYLAQLLLLGSLSGWIARRLVGSNLEICGLEVFFGLAGLYMGSWLWHSLSWHPGPMVGNFSLLASFAGAIMLVGFFKLIEVAVSATAHS